MAERNVAGLAGLAVGAAILLAIARSTPARAADGTAVVGSTGDIVHPVAPGDTLFAIAMDYGTTVPALVRANGLGRDGFIRPGQRLIVAGATRGGGGAFDGATRGADVADVDAGDGTAADDDGGADEDVDADGGVDADADAFGDVDATGGERRIVIDLSDQTLSAYAGGRRDNRFIVSTGAAWTPTPLGTYAVYARYDRQRMTGIDYDLPNVPYVQYFTGSYAIHGAYWHQLFGVPVSHGCVNLQVDDAAWLWDWADQGTPVVVQP